ncbi:diguanylate cyclase [Saccharibacillus sp. CPCC 101409]|uniref:sensor domain-containing diguanylate cyclase n=1 Tax=Saccharibacillus sp. CPCC 101409 TaxID=3058041 RepID=UPI0026730CDB|nr:diguanylate cyclase [Saccharibacillus sp. CPCC 101409]MDO3408887.1 diguanylate cyclase [Saccharibacillus sp. CPCC 101409]
MNHIPRPFGSRKDYVGSSVIKVSFISIIVFTLFMLGSLLYLNHSIKSDYSKVKGAADIRFKIGEMADSLIDQQINQRSFLLTRNTDFLKDFEEHGVRFHLLSSELLALLKDYPQYSAQADELIELGNRWRSEHSDKLLIKALQDGEMSAELSADKQDFDTFRSKEEALSKIFNDLRVKQRNILLSHLAGALIGIGLVFALLQTLFIYFTQRGLKAITRPITKLEQFVADYTSGSTSALIPDYERKDEIGSLIEHVRMMQDAQNRDGRLIEEMFDFVDRLNRASTPQEVYRESVTGTGKLLGASRVMLVTSNRDRSFSAKAQIAGGVVEMNPPHPALPPEMAYAAFHHPYSLIFDDWSKEKPKYVTIEKWYEEGVRSSLHVPLRQEGHNIGYLHIASAEAGHFTPIMIQRMEKITRMISGSLKNAADSQDMQLVAMKDGLTGAWNRRFFDIELDKLIAEYRSGGAESAPFCLILLDVDHFKRFNDTWGHMEGDQVLKHVVGTLQTFSRPADLVARFGGEEFAVLLPATPLAEARAAAERLRKLIEHDSCSSNYHITASFGVAEFAGGLHARNGKEELIQQVDRALYRAKQSGRNRVEPASTDSGQSENGMLWN